MNVGLHKVSESAGKFAFVAFSAASVCEVHVDMNGLRAKLVICVNNAPDASRSLCMGTFRATVSRKPEQMPLLGPDPIALCVGIVPIVAAFDAATPTHTRLGIDILSAIQPVVVSRALHGVYARLIDGVWRAGALR
jgi:hypothetical protein